MEGLENYEKPNNQPLSKEEISKILKEFGGKVWEDGEYFAYKINGGEGRVHKWHRIPHKVNGDKEDEEVVGIPIEDFLREKLSENEIEGVE